MRSMLLASLSGLLILVGAVSYAGENSRPSDSGKRAAVSRDRAEATKPFTGSIRIRQKDGTLYYDFKVRRGKVTGGTCALQNRKGVMFDIVGGWYDRERLTLMLQSRGDNINDQWFTHTHQFRRTDTGFHLEHTLFGFGKTIESGIVYQPHVIDRMEERD